jgi:O-acetyl-ADP-ribose deacetylase (regulator of RNase III)
MFLVQGDLLNLAKNGEFDVIVHGCNCFNTMGAGIARQIRDQFPEAYAADCNTLKGDQSKLGHYTTATVGSLTIVNAYTQYCYGQFGKTKDLFEYDAFVYILEQLAVEYYDKRFGFPLIGTGLAGGDPVRILTILENFSEKIANQGGSVTLVDYYKK